uniref:intermembrane transport protein PqiB n=1 Tax=Thaumasiovibrio occultus TaxID=1891184 RepID=UPI000B355DDE|nr:intermembrane transport protein PqiB [Thaumasiovibrio occultus]
MPHNNAKTTSLKQISSIWIIPILALVMAGWMLYQHISTQGETITLYMENAEGIEAGKTEIRALNVKVGVITNIELNKDYSAIIATAQMDSNASRMLNSETQMWVVKPRVGKEGVSGLNTLLSGSYIELRPGNADDHEDKFTLLDIPPVAPPDAEGLRVILTSNQAGKLGIGDPVLYEGFTVGRVEKVDFNTATRQANYQLFIQAPFDALVFQGSRFWLTSGVNVSLSANGVDLEIGSLESLLTGGVTMQVPQGRSSGKQITEDMTEYKLYDNVSQMQEHYFDRYIEYVMLFDESIRGLAKGAPVEFRGIRIGTVEQVPLSRDSGGESFSDVLIPVLVRIELGRIAQHIRYDTLPDLRDELEREFHKGLRGALKSGNLLTGSLLIDLEVHNEAPSYVAGEFDDYPLFPTVKGGRTQLQAQLSSILNKINNLPVEDTLSTLNRTLQTSQGTLNATAQMMRDMSALLENQDLNQLPRDMRDSLETFQQTLNDFNSNSAPYQELNQVLIQLEQVMTEIRPVIRQLNEQPNSLIFDADKADDPYPRGGEQ